MLHPKHLFTVMLCMFAEADRIELSLRIVTRCVDDSPWAQKKKKKREKLLVHKVGRQECDW